MRQRDRDRNGHKEERERNPDHDDMYRRDRRRRRVDDLDDPKPPKRIREDEAPPTPMSVDLPSKEDRRPPRSRDSDRRSVRSGRGPRDPRDDIDVSMKASPKRERGRSVRRDLEERPLAPPPKPPLADEEHVNGSPERSGSQRYVVDVYIA